MSRSTPYLKCNITLWCLLPIIVQLHYVACINSRFENNYLQTFDDSHTNRQNRPFHKNVLNWQINQVPRRCYCYCKLAFKIN